MDHPRRFGLNEKARQAILTRGDETTSGETYDMIGECFLLARRLAEAEAAFRQGNAAVPNAGVLEYNLARVAAAAGKPAEALAHLEKALACAPARRDRPLPAAGRGAQEARPGEGTGAERLEKLYAAEASNAALGRFLAGAIRPRGTTSTRPKRSTWRCLKKDPTVAAYKELIELCRKATRRHAPGGAWRRASKKKACWRRFGGRGESDPADAALLRPPRRGRPAAAAARSGEARLRHAQGGGAAGPRRESSMPLAGGVLRPGDRRPAQGGGRSAADLGRGPVARTIGRPKRPRCSSAGWA